MAEMLISIIATQPDTLALRLRTAAKAFLLANKDWLQAEEAWVDRFGDRKDLYLEIHD